VSGTRRYLSVALDGRSFGIEVERVREVVRRLPITPVPRAAPAVAGLVNLRGQVVPVVDLRLRLGLPAGGAGVIVVVAADEGPRGALADEVGDVIEVEDEAFEPPAETLKGPARELIRGIYKLETGLLLALDVERAIDPAARSRG
jgi:purine-binding chemotaxis protein CheW